MSKNESQEKEFTFKDYFVPLTTTKVIHFIILIGVVIFFNGLFNGFVSDDNTFVLNNPAIQSFSNIPKLFFENKYDSAGQTFIGGLYYRPIPELFYAINYIFFDASPFPFHFFQILLYIANACLLFFIFKHFFTKSIAFILSLLFLLHPINSENAFYIATIQEALFFFFGSTALLITIKQHTHRAIILASICLLISLLSKETGILFIIMIILYSAFYKRKVLKPIVGYSAVAIFTYIVMRLFALGDLARTATNSPIEQMSLGERIVNIPAIIFYYIKTFLFPFDLATSYQWVHRKITFEYFYSPLLIDILFLTVILVIGIFLYKKSSRKNVVLFIFFSLWIFIGFALHLQIYPLDQTVAERWFYFPIVGLLGLIGVIFEATKLKMTNRWFLLIIVAILILFSIRIIVRSFDFRNDATLVKSDIQTSKDSYSLEYIASGVYLNEGNLLLAKKHGERSVELFPTITSYTNLGVIYLREGEYKKAKESYMNGLRYGDDQVPYANLAQLALIYGDQKENITFLRSAAKKYPHSPTIWLSLAILEYVNGDKINAQSSIDQAKNYSNSPQILFLHEVISNDKPLHLEIENGQIQFNTSP